MKREKVISAILISWAILSIMSLSYGDNNKKNRATKGKVKTTEPAKNTTKPVKVRAHSGMLSTKFFENCEQCHVTAGWAEIKPSVKFDHRVTGFPLRGRHKDLSCDRCHNRKLKKKSGEKKFQMRTCAHCHKSPHGPTLGKNCESCHNEQSWQPTQLFQAHQKTAFPLTGAHASTPCESCHVSRERGKFKRLPTDCVACHSRNFLAVKEPDHNALKFGTKCSNCHTTIAWSPSFFDHDKYWPLEGAHRRVRCTSCHPNGRYKGTPKECISCHQKDYERAGHYEPAFPTTCNVCHSMNSWEGAQFAGHDRYFPITTGNHSGFKCKECHTTSYKSFNCLEPCHGKAETTAQHEGEVSGFVYESKACYRCHPTGEGDD